MKKNLLFILINIFYTLFCITTTYAQSTFTNIAPSAGINHYHNVSMGFGGGVAVFDYNNDNFEDLYYTGGWNVDKLYQNNGNGTFTDVTVTSGLAAITDGLYSTGVATGDVDNDGFRDLLVYTFWTQHAYLFHNNGDGTFTDITISAGLHQDSSFMMGATFGDYDKDSYLDLYIVNYVAVPQTIVDSLGNFVSFNHICAANRLYHNNGNNTFTDVSQLYGVDNAGCSLATTFTDYDNDGDLDLWTVNDFGEWILPDALYQNNFPSGGFVDVSVAANVALEIYGMGIAVGDYDQDMDLDYYITNIGPNVFHHNNGNGTFVDTAVGSGVDNHWVIPDSVNATGWGTGFMDIDNDSYLDLFVSNGHIDAVPFLATSVIDPDKLYRNNGNGTFTDISAMTGIDSTTISRGFAYGDCDNDGDIDLIPVPIRSNFSIDTILVPLYRNDLNNGYNWLKVKLQGTVSNRDAFGTKILIYVAGKSWMHEVSGGNSHLSHVSSVAHFGLGTASIVDSLIIKWPNGIVERMYAVSPNQTLYLVEGLVTNTKQIDTEGFGFNILPNPASDNFLLVYQQKQNSAVRLNIFNAVGQIVLTQQELQQIAGEHQIRIDTQSFENGLYFVNMEFEGKIWTQKLIIQHR